MKNPFAGLRDHFRLKGAVRAANDVLQSPDFQGESTTALFIEMSGYRPRDEQVDLVVNTLEQAVANGKTEEAMEGMAWLAKRYGVARDGGITSELIVALQDRVPQADSEITEDLVERVRALYEEQNTWPNQEREAKLAEANATFHKRYPSTFLNELAHGGDERQHALDTLS